MSGAGGPPGFGCVRLCAWLVPGSRRDDWLEEWRSELAHGFAEAREAGEDPARTSFRLRLRALASVRDGLSLRWLDRSVLRWPDPRDALRLVTRQPGFLLTVVATLGLGMGAATAMYSVLNALVVNPLPFHDPARLVMISDEASGVVTRPLLEQLKAEARVFESVSAYYPRSVVMTGAGEPQNLRLEAVDPGFLDLLGLAPRVGRNFGEDEAVAGRDRVILIGDGLWRGTFGSDPGVIGRTIRLSGESWTVIGVLPPALRRMPMGLVDGVVPLVPSADRVGVLTLGRLRAGISLEVAQSRLDAIGDLLEMEMPGDGGFDPRASFLGDGTGARSRPALIALAGAALFLLLVSCANAAGLLSVRGVARESEFAVRGALGASRGALFRQLLAESLVMAVLAGALGALIAALAVRGMLAIAPESITRWHYNTVRVDGRTFGFAFVLTVLTGVFFGLVPAAWASRRTEAVRLTDRTATDTGSRARTRRVVQVVQVALAVLLLSGAGLLGHSFIRLSATDPGYDPDRLIELTLPTASGRDAAGRATFNRRLDERLRAIPGVTAVGWSNGTGLHVTTGLQAEGVDPASGPTRMIISSSVDSTYFRAMGIALVEGRGFGAADVVEGGDAAIVDRDFAALLWPDRSPLGQRFRIDEGRDWYTVVGVIEDAKLEGLDDRANPWVIFFPTAPQNVGYAAISVRTATDPAGLIPAVRDAVRSLDPDVPIYGLVTGNAALAATIAEPRFALVVMAAFAVIALVLAGLGVFALVSFSVAQRSREIGIRMAIGASEGAIVRAIAGEGMVLAGSGIAIGLAAAFALARSLESLLFGIERTDPLTYVAVTLVLLLAFATALLRPLQRARAIDPAATLRNT